MLGIQSNLTKSTNALSIALERMSTGYKINSAKDDDAGLFVATGLDSRLNGLKVASGNVSNALSLLNIGEGSLTDIGSILDRIRDLAVQGANGTYDEASRKSMQDEVDTLLKEIERVQRATSFNTMNIFDGSAPSPDTANWLY